MRYLIFLLLMLAGCAGGRVSSREPWPSLAKRAVETTAPVANADLPVGASPAGASLVDASPAGPGRPVATDGAATAPMLPAPASSDAALLSGKASARLVIAARDVDSLEQRWRVQQLATQRATAAAQAHPDAETAGSAQLETGRLDKLAGQSADERAQLEGIAGDLAVAAAAGVDVGGPLRTAGALLGRCARLTIAGPAASGGGATRGDP